MNLISVAEKLIVKYAIEVEEASPETIPEDMELIPSTQPGDPESIRDQQQQKIYKLLRQALGPLYSYILDNLLDEDDNNYILNLEIANEADTRMPNRMLSREEFFYTLLEIVKSLQKVFMGSHVAIHSSNIKEKGLIAKLVKVTIPKDRI